MGRSRMDGDLVKRVEELEKRLDKIEQEIQEKPKHQFKVGDRVQFKTWEEMEEEFGLDEMNSINIKWKFLPIMKHLCGTYATITKIKDDKIGCGLTDFTARGSVLWNYSLDMLKPAVDESKWQFTEDEKVILRNVDEKFRWIARDGNGQIWLYKEEPERGDYDWESSSCTRDFNCFQHLFKALKWGDREPCEFREYI